MNFLEILLYLKNDFIRLLFPEIYFSFSELNNFYLLNNKIEKAKKVMIREVDLKKMILGNQNIEIVLSLWQYGNIKFLQSNKKNLQDFLKAYNIDSNELIDEDSIEEIIKIFKIYCMNQKIIPVRVTYIFKKLYSLLVNIKLRLENCNDIWRNIQREMIELLLIIEDVPIIELIEDKKKKVIYSKKIQSFNFEIWHDIKIFKDL